MGEPVFYYRYRFTKEKGMFLIYKEDKYFGVHYENLFMAQFVCEIFKRTLGREFSIRFYPAIEMKYQ